MHRNRSWLRRGLGIGLAIGASALPLNIIAAGVSSAASTPNASSTTGVSKTAIKIGLITSLSGDAASSYGEPVVQGAKAAFDAINAKGGINGRKLQLVVADDGSSSTQALTATQSLVSQGVYGIMVADPFFFGAYRYAVTEGIPTVGNGLDGPEWGSPSNPNLFGMWGSYAPNYPTFTTVGKYFKKYGATKLGAVTFGSSPSGTAGTKAGIASAQLQGIPTPVADFSATFGDTNFTADALAMKNAGVNAIYAEMTTSSNIALLEALKQDGVKLKAEFISGGYQEALLQDPASLSAAQGIDFQSEYAPADLNNAATKAFASTLAKYANYHLPNPQESQGFGYFDALAMIKGIQVAGKNPTWGSFITNLRKVTNYTADGLIAPINFTKFGNVDATSAGNCWYQLVVKGTKFVPLSTKPFCGTEVAGTSN